METTTNLSDQTFDKSTANYIQKQAALVVKLKKYGRYRNIYSSIFNLKLSSVSVITFFLFYLFIFLGGKLIIDGINNITDFLLLILYSLICIGFLFFVISNEIRIIRCSNELDLINSKINLSKQLGDLFNDEFLSFNSNINNSFSNNQISKINVINNNSYFDKLVAINLENLGSYYNLVKVHTDNSFYLNICAGSIGFILIIVGILIGLFREDRAIVSYVAFGSGIITEFITGVFFFLYTRSIRELKSYHDSLLKVQNILLSFKLIGDVTDDEQKIQMISQMLNSLSSIEKSIKH